MALAPDLSKPAERKAYRRELAAYRRRTRSAGLAIVAVGLLMAFSPRLTGRWLMVGSVALQDIGWLVLALGCAILVGVILLRMRHHRRRMKGLS